MGWWPGGAGGGVSPRGWHKRPPRGEVTLAVRGLGKEAVAVSGEDAIKTEIQRLQRKGFRVKEIAELLGEKFSCSKREVYRLALEIKK